MNNETMKDAATPNGYPTVPLWLWRMSRISLVTLILLIAALVSAVWFGMGNPQPYGSLQWQDRFEKNVRWQMFGTTPELNQGGLVITLKNQGDLSGAVTPVEAATPFTLEVAATQFAGERGAWYGLILNYEDEQHYTMVLVNNNGYTKILERSGKILLAPQEWPHLQLGTEANRVRVDAAQGVAVVRLNDEVLPMRVTLRAGQVGVVVLASNEAQQVRFNWVKLWK